LLYTQQGKANANSSFNLEQAANSAN